MSDHGNRAAVRARVCILALGLLSLAAPAAQAHPSEVSMILARCAGTELGSLRGFSPQAYSRALAEVPTVLGEYSDCPGEIREAELARVGLDHGARPTSTTTPPSVAEQRAMTMALLGGAPAEQGTLPAPGLVHLDPPLGALPTSLILLMALLAALMLAIGGDWLRRGLRRRFRS